MGEGISLDHNPNTKNPLPIDFFPNATQYVFEEMYIKSIMPNIHVYSLITNIIYCKK